MIYLYTAEQQSLANKLLSQVFDIQIIDITFNDMEIETIRSKRSPKLLGENNGMFNKQHKESTKKLIGDANRSKISVKDKEGNTLRVDKDDPRYISGELVGIAKDMISVKDKEGNQLLVHKDDPRYISGELVGVNKGKKFKQKVPSPHKGTILVKNRQGNMCRMKKDDPRYLSGEYIHFKRKFSEVFDLIEK